MRINVSFMGMNFRLGSEIQLISHRGELFELSSHPEFDAIAALESFNYALEATTSILDCQDGSHEVVAQEIGKTENFEDLEVDINFYDKERR